EIRDLFQESENNQWVETFFPEPEMIDKDKELAKLSYKLTDIRTAIQFIEHHGEKSQKKQHLKRRELSLDTLEKNYSEEAFSKKLEEVLLLKEQWEQLVDERQQLEDQENWLLNWQNLDLAPKAFDSQMTKLVIGTVNAKNAESFKAEVAEINEAYLEEINSSPTTTYFAYIVLRADESRMEEIASRYGFVKEDYLYEGT
ncbi:V-type ATP synthase subunit I, partial [Enterococcus faecium]